MHTEADPRFSSKKNKKTLDILFTQLKEEGLRIMISKKKTSGLENVK